MKNIVNFPLGKNFNAELGSVKNEDYYRDLLLDLSTKFINLPLDEIDSNINSALEKMANLVGADRAYVFDYKENIAKNTYEWCAKNIVPQIEKLQNVKMCLVPEWYEVHAKGEYILIQDIALLDEGLLHDILFSQEIQSLVAFPLLEGKDCKGFVSFDAVKEKHHFSKMEISILELFSKILINIADRKRKEGELSRERSYLKTLIQAIPDLIWIKDINGVYLSCNSRFEDLFGAKEVDIVGKNDYDFVDKDLADFFGHNDNIVMQSGQLNINEEKLSFADGHEEVSQTTKVPMYDQKGNLYGVLGVSRDITSIKEIQQELEVQRNRFSLAIDGAQDALWDWNILTNELFLSEQFEKMLGYKKGDIVHDIDSWFNLLHPDDKEVTSKFVYDYLDSKGKGIYECSFRLRTKDGSWKWILGRGKAQFNKHGKAVRFVGFNTDITEKRVLEQKLKESYNKLYKLTENIPGVIFQYKIYSDGSSSFPYASKGVESVYEVSIEEVLNDSTSMFKYLHPSDLSNLGTSIKESVETMKIWDFKYRIILPQKGLRWLHGKATPEKLEDNSILFNGVINDITDQVIQQERLLSQAKLIEEKKQVLETIIKFAPNPIMIHNESGEVVLVNDVWQELTGYSYSEINTIEKWAKNAYRDEMSVVKKNIDKLYANNDKTDEGEFEIKTKNGDTLIWQFSSAPLGNIDGIRTIISSAMDITELKKKDKMIIAQSRHAAMGEMISMIAHQWRQPLAIMSMDANNILLDIALDELNEKDVEEAFHKIISRIEHLSKTIDDFSNFFKPDKDILEVNIKNILDDTYSIMKDSLKNNNISYKASIETEIKVKAYPRELMQVFISIISNAKDAILAHGIDNGLINIRVYDDKNYVSTELCDNGNGIEKNILNKIFDPYFSTKNEMNGTGLGLYMSKMIIEDYLHGKIEVSNKGKGVCFKISLLK
ncbi:MAG: PAS domain S-box-containing protein [Sulfurimonas sp.]